MKLRRGPRRGVTLVELMVVVAIAGILAAMSAYSFRAVNELGRLNGAASTLATVLTNTRVRAITERCTYVVQVSGPAYAPVAGTVGQGGSLTPNAVTVFRKRDCNSAQGFFETAAAPLWPDRRVEDYNLSEFGVMVQLPAAVIPGGELGDRAVSIAYTANGQRLIFRGDQNGAFVDSGFGLALPLGLTIRPAGMPTSPTLRAVNVPGAGAAEAP